MLGHRISLYLGSLSGLLAESSIDVYRERLNRFHAFVGRQKVTPFLAKEWLGHMLNVENLNRNNAAQHYGSVRTFYDWLVEHDKAKSNPIPRLRHFVVPRQERERMMLDEVATLTNWFKEKGKAEWRYATLCGWETAMRLSDVVQLQWREVDIKQKLIRRVPQKTQRFGKAVEIPISTALLEAMHDVPKYPDGDPSYVASRLAQFYKFDGHKTLSAMFIQYARKAGVDKSFHALRHGRTSHLLNKGVPITIVRAITGHSLMQLQGYSHVDISEKRKGLAS